MVSRLISLFTVLILLWSATGQALANNELTVEPDRLQLHEDEVLTLTVKGSMKIDINLENLFDLGVPNLPAPDIEKLEADFTVLGQNQHYSIRTVNSEMRGEITWTYQLAPKRTGEITIPELTFKDSRSKPVTITVSKGPAPEPSNAARDAFIELSADKDRVYVQEQLILTVRLFFTGNLIRGDLSAPEHPDAIIETLGKQREYNRHRDGRQYRVVERRYAIFPQKPGELTLSQIRFEGQARDSSGQLRFLRDSARLFDIPVAPIPDGFTGNTWLPASSLELSESGIPASGRLAEGDNLTRTLTLKAQGLPSEALPPLATNTPAGIRAYPEKPERVTDTGDGGLSSTLVQTAALVAVRAGQVELPEIRIPWWDTGSDSEKVAVIPARTLDIIPAGASSGRGQDSQDLTSPAGEAAPQGDDAAGPEAPVESTTGTFWPWLSLLLAVGWGITLLLWRRRPRQGPEQGPTADDLAERGLFDQLRRAAGDGSPRTLELLPRWMAAHRPGHTFTSVADVVKYAGDAGLAQEMERLQRHLFAVHPRSAPTSPEASWDGGPLVKALERLRNADGKTPGDDCLPPLYPEHLSSQQPGEQQAGVSPATAGR